MGRPITHHISPGQRFGRLTTTERIPMPGGAVWKCLCDCGSIVSTTPGHLYSGHTRSCGCLYSEVLVSANTTHGKSQSPEYRSWSMMRTRCNNPRVHNYHRYGGRGITVCERWNKSFEHFLQDVGPRPSLKHSIDRINVNGNYEPGNVRWATASEQALNQRVKTHCDRGHEFTEQNTYRWTTPTGTVKRRCRRCQRLYEASQRK